MMPPPNCLDPLKPGRRAFLKSLGTAGLAAGLGRSLATGAASRTQGATSRDQALVAITLDLEMSANFPRWEMTHWNYEKGNLDDATKRYTVEACRRVRDRGGVVHNFVVGRVFEQESVDWLGAILEAGHPVGNHTYDHVSVTAMRPEDLGWRFRRAPWLLRGMTPREAIEDNIRLVDAAMEARLGAFPAGFRTPGGLSEGLDARPDLQQMFVDLGYTWVSSKYPRGAGSQPIQGQAFSPAVLDGIVGAQGAAQPYRYPNGLIEIPMSPISDIGAFRRQRDPWRLEEFIEATRRALEWAIEYGKVFDFLSHPSCLGVVDPEFRTIDMICDVVEQAGNRARIVDLDTIARRVAG
jgi:peptidoglycan/xylan/chitin deacetylase (PgdA/CDA1 family)